MKDHVEEIRRYYREEATELRRQMYDAARIDPEMLNDEFVKLPALRAYWSARAADAHRVLEAIRNEKVRLRALLVIQSRRELEEERGKGAKNVTIEMVNARVDLKERWLELLEEELEAEITWEEHKGTLAALSDKRDMLVQLGAQYRAEMEGDPTIREQARAKHFRRTNTGGEE